MAEDGPIQRWWKTLDHPISFAGNTIAVVVAVVGVLWWHFEMNRGVEDGAKNVGELNTTVTTLKTTVDARFDQLDAKLDAKFDGADDRWRETFVAINGRVDDTNARIDATAEPRVAVTYAAVPEHDHNNLD